jgi:hypothetical protein
MWFAPLALVAFAAFVVIGGAIVMTLWNWLLPPLFGWRTIGVWQAIGLLALCRILFGGFGMHGGHRGGMRRRMADRMADRVADRWEHMTPEERERFRERLRNRCGVDVAEPKTM